MPASGVPGQQATPNAIRARPVTRATVAAMPVSSAPSSSCPTSDGTTSNAIPVATSMTAVTTSTAGERFVRSLVSVQELPPRHAMSAQEEAEHHARRQEIAREDRPPRDRLEQPLGERLDHDEREDLEAAEQHDEGEEQARLPVGQREQPGGEPAEDDEGQAVQRGVLR